LQSALALAASGDQVWVAQGTYLPTSTGNRALSFALKTGVAIYGGFAGGESTLAQRDPVAHVAILSGDLNGDDASNLFGDNSYHVVNGNATAATAVLDGFTVSGGNANVSGADQDRGGGMLMSTGSNPMIAQCIVKNNRCTFGGGAIYFRQASPTFTDVRFESNNGGSFGGAFDMSDSVGSLVSRCTFVGNTAARAGAVEVFSGSAPKIANCLFYNNTSTGSGGGGALFISGSGPQIRDCTIVGNNSTVNAAAGILQSGSGASLANSIVYFNTGPGGAQGSANQITGLSNTTYSCVQGGIAGAGNISGNPQLSNIGGGDFTLSSSSPCIDAGNNASVTAGTTLDLAQNPRFVDDPGVADTGAGSPPIVDMGAFEAPNTLYSSFCAGDAALATPCPCNNFGQLGHGCANSDSFSIGALEAASGAANPDTVVITASEMLPSVLCIFLQGDAQNTNGIPFGDGVRCVSGHLKRLASKNAASGTAMYPESGDLSITARSAQLGDTIAPGSVRYYQVYYRDPDLTFCPAPQGDSWNVTNAIAVQW
jgi:predicted outer membrane repeat protein